MARLFGLSLFIQIFVVGILLGNGKRRLSLAVAGLVFVYLAVVYLGMGLVVATGPDFLVPHH